MFKLMRNSGVASGFKNCRIDGTALVWRRFSDQAVQKEKTMNKTRLLGRIGADPQTRGTDEHPIMTFSVATHKPFYTQMGILSEKVEWHQVVVFKSSLREYTANYVRKGQRVLVHGKLIYEDATDRHGNHQIMSNILAEDIVCIQQ